MEFDLLQFLKSAFSVRKLEDDAEARAVLNSKNVKFLRDPLRENDDDVDSAIEHLLETGPHPEQFHLEAAFVHTVFDRCLLMHPREIKRAIDSNWVQTADRRFLKALERYFPDAWVRLSTGDERWKEIYRPYTVTFLTLERKGEFAVRAVESARAWVDKYSDTYRYGLIEHNGGIEREIGHAISVILDGEADFDQQSDEWRRWSRQADEIETKLMEETDPIATGNHEFLTNVSKNPRLKEFQYLSIKIFELLSPKNRNVNRNQKTAEVMGEAALACIEEAENQALQAAKASYGYWKQHNMTYENCLNEARNFGIKNNQGLARLVTHYSKKGESNKAVEICDACIANGITDGTKSGFEGRKRRIIKMTK